jgi:hypothetical protein
MFHQRIVLGLAVLLGAALAHGEQAGNSAPNALSPEQMALLEKAVVREKVTLQEIQKHSPLVQTYIQNMRPDPVLSAVPESDRYYLGRVDLGKSIGTAFQSSEASRRGLFKGSVEYVSSLSKAFRMKDVALGFMEMMFLDTLSFDQKHYDFTYVRRDFLGSVRTLVFDVHPKPGGAHGRFDGRIWIEDQDGSLARDILSHRDSSRNIQQTSWCVRTHPSPMFAGY